MFSSNSDYLDIGFALNRLCMTMDLLEEERTKISPLDLEEMEKHLNALLVLVDKIRQEQGDEVS